ncbi:MAG: carbamoyltransferase HypF, partial [Sandaracinaceae bacterium]|nr:carbamoyltransferase HypF [Sandaracinaceae bacterium]
MRTRRVGVVRGVVQGVGFRPFVARLAREEALAGRVENAGGVVHLDVEGDDDALARFLSRLRAEAPPAARVDEVALAPAAPTGADRFVIADSAAGAPDALPLPPDLATCAECLAEVLDPSARRAGYPFTNCTQCGPRFTITTALPYDRARTTMAGFPLCGACRAEHDAPADRRFHAQPIACPACGPRLYATRADGAALARERAALEVAIAALRRGEIVAVKGLGGYQLLTDATDEAAVRRLRERKRREAKPLALLVRDLEGARAIAHVGELEARALASPAGPIVLLSRRDGSRIAPSVAPDLGRLGVLLPTTPLHHLLARALGPLVCTSGNLHDEPIATDDADARARLAGVADVFLAHDRPIARRADDGVVQVVAGAARTLRVGRGLGPLSVAIGGDGARRLCVGAHLKNAPAAALGAHAIVWPHVGDLDSPRARAAFEEAVGDLERFLALAPEAIVCDRHPDYASTIWAERAGLPLVRVGHHHAHVAACLAEHGAEAALGFAWDGFGLGEDGGLWGGEALAVGAAGARRVASLRAFP